MNLDDLVMAMGIFIPYYLSFMAASVFLSKKYDVMKYPGLRSILKYNCILALTFLAYLIFCCHQVSWYSGKTVGADTTDHYQNFLLWGKYTGFTVFAILVLGIALLITTIGFIVIKKRRKDKM